MTDCQWSSFSAINEGSKEKKGPPLMYWEMVVKKDLSTLELDFLNAMLSSYLCPLVTIPTRIMHSSATLIFVDGQPLNGFKTDVLVNDGSDNLMLMSKIDSLKSRPTKDDIKHRDLSENSFKILAVNLEHVDFSEVFK